MKYPGYCHVWLVLCLLLGACGEELEKIPQTIEQRSTVALSFIHNQTPFSQKSILHFQSVIEEKNLTLAVAIADHDPDTQYLQIEQFVRDEVGGIICYPQDARTVIPMIRLANQSGIPMVIYARPPAASSAVAGSVAAENFELAKHTATAIIEQVTGPTINAVIFMERFDELAAIRQRDGILSALKDQAKPYQVQEVILNPFHQNAAAEVKTFFEQNPECNVGIATSEGFETIMPENFYFGVVENQNIEAMVTETVDILLDQMESDPSP